MSGAPVKTTLPVGTETCGCCDGIAASTPRGVDNRIGLPAVRYRIGEYGDFMNSLLAGLSSSAYPALAGLRTRERDDYTIALFDAVACAADVLTFYQERTANESWLRTATERVSLQEMAKLIGYHLRPGLAAETWLSFALETPRFAAPATTAASAAPEPGAFFTGIPTALSLPTGLKVQSVPGPDERPQTFETVEPLAARPEWNAVRPWLSVSHAPVFGDQDAWLQGVRNNLKAGDALLFVGTEFDQHPTTDNHWDFRLLDSVALDSANDRTHVHWSRALGSYAPASNPSAAPRVHALRRRAAVFGNNAPMWRSLTRDFRTQYPDGAAHVDTDWPHFNISPNAADANGGDVDLDALQAEAVPGGYAVLAKGEFNRPNENFASGTYVELYRITGASEVSRAEFAISGKVTRLGLSGQNLNTVFYGHVRETSVYLQSEELALARQPLDLLVSGDRLPLALPPDGLLPGRRLIVNGLADADGSAVVHEATVLAVTADAEGAVLTITPPLPVALQRTSVVVHLNVALASHGETVAQILGAGDASKPFQRYELKRSPLTYRGASTESGAASELTVRVGDVQWRERSTLYGASSDARSYTLLTDEQARVFVQFGDGEHGARLPSGVNNVRASYRVGIGQDGNVGAGQLTQLLTRPLGLKSVSNPLPARGGTDAEPAEWARRSMPLGTRTLGRAVSLLDYQDFALAFTGIAKAQAQVLQLAAGPTIAITVAGQDGDPVPPTSPVWGNLLDALKAGGDPHVNVTLLSYQANTFKLGLKVKRDPTYDMAAVRVAVEAALRAHFAFDARELAQPVFASDVIAAAQAVPGVVAVDLDFLYGGSAPPAQTSRSLQTRLQATRMRVEGGVAMAAELLTLDPAPFERLEEMS